MVQAEVSGADLFEQSSEHPKFENLLELHAREIAGMGDDWHAFVWEAKGYKVGPPFVPGTHVAVTGAVVTKRNRKGELEFRSRDKSTELVITISTANHLKWCETWGASNGVCWHCQGHAVVAWSWGIGETKYRQCKDCNGSGKPPSNGDSSDDPKSSDRE